MAKTMGRNAQGRGFRRNYHDSGTGMFMTLVEQKAERANRQVVKLDQWFASSKLCSDCGFKKTDPTLKDRAWVCANCGSKHERNVNTALNILKAGRALCRDDIRLNQVKQLSMKQELLH